MKLEKIYYLFPADGEELGTPRADLLQLVRTKQQTVEIIHTSRICYSLPEDTCALSLASSYIFEISNYRTFELNFFPDDFSPHRIARKIPAKTVINTDPKKITELLTEKNKCIEISMWRYINDWVNRSNEKIKLTTPTNEPWTQPAEPIVSTPSPASHQVIETKSSNASAVEPDILATALHDIARHYWPHFLETIKLNPKILDCKPFGKKETLREYLSYWHPHILNIASRKYKTADYTKIKDLIKPPFLTRASAAIGQLIWKNTPKTSSSSSNINSTPKPY